jgi:hypothetical protein
MVRQAAPIIRVSAPRAPKAKKHRRKHSGGSFGGGLTTNTLVQHALGGAAFGFIEKSFPTLPTIPFLGRAGTIAIGAYFLGGKRGGIMRDIALAAAAIAGYELGNTGKISGPDYQYGVHGIASQV